MKLKFEDLTEEQFKEMCSLLEDQNQLLIAFREKYELLTDKYVRLVDSTVEEIHENTRRIKAETEVLYYLKKRHPFVYKKILRMFRKVEDK